MKRLLVTLAAIGIAVPLFAQQPPAATQTPAAPPPKNDAIAPPLEYAADVLKASPRHGEWVDIKMAGGPAINSWVVYPERKEKVGVVLVIHDIYGMPTGAGDWPRAVGDQLAKAGFIAIVPDLLSGKGPNGGGAPEIGAAGIGQAIRTLTMPDVAARLDAAMAYGKTLPASNGKTGVIGFCWGGDKSFGYAAAQPALSAAVVYYGQVPQIAGQAGVVDEAAVTKIKAPVIGFYGGTDSRVNQTIDPTKAAMTKLNKSYDPHIFAGAGHGFLRNQSGGNGANYNASVEAWPLTVAFFTKNLK